MECVVKYLKFCFLELGGKVFLIVFDDVDIGGVVNVVNFGVFMN